MFRNNYDNDSVTFSPQGRIFQVEYAQEAVKQGSVVVGIVSKTHAVLAAIKVSACLFLYGRNRIQEPRCLRMEKSCDSAQIARNTIVSTGCHRRLG
jgi:hypothetical protein